MISKKYMVLLNELVQVTVRDQFIGSVPKWDAHLNSYISQDTSFPHRAFSIFLFNSENKLLLQRRSKDKKTFPLQWTNTCCSHPNMIQFEGQTQKNVENIRDSLHRALDRELKLNLTKEKFNFINKIVYKAQGSKEEGFGQYQVDYIYLCKLNQKEVDLTIVPQEVSEVEWVSKDEFAQFLNKKQKTEKCSFTPWFMKMFNHGLVYKWWNLAIENKLSNATKEEQKYQVTSL